jgi:hypothetical protein
VRALGPNPLRTAREKQNAAHQGVVSE